MIRPLTRRRLAIGLGAGVIAGAAIAAFEPAATGSTSVQPYAAPSTSLRLAGARRPLGNTPNTLRSLRGATTTSRPVLDPAGGPAWVVRISAYRYADPWLAAQNASRGIRRTALTTLWCGQLLRQVDGRLGWIDGENTFRPVNVTQSEGDAPRVCIGGGIRSSTTAQSFTLLEHPGEPEPRALGGVVWGFSALRVRGHRLTVDGHRVAVRPQGPHSAFIAFQPSATRLRTALTVELPSGRRQQALTDGAWTGRLNGSSDERIRSATEHIAARAADPGGGASWGLVVAQRDDGRWCSTVAGQLVGRFAGTIDQRLGTFSRQSVLNQQGSCLGGQDLRPSRARPVVIVPSGYVVNSPGDFPTGQALRRQRGRASIAGRTVAGVRSVTIATATSVRTVTPSGPEHAFLTVYDTGSLGLMNFARATARITVRFDDGHTKSTTVPTPGL